MDFDLCDSSLSGGYIVKYSLGTSICKIGNGYCINKVFLASKQIYITQQDKADGNRRIYEIIRQ